MVPLGRPHPPKEPDDRGTLRPERVSDASRSRSPRRRRHDPEQGLSGRHGKTQRLLLGILDHALHIWQPAALGLAAVTPCDDDQTNGNSLRGQAKEPTTEASSDVQTRVWKAELGCASAAHLSSGRAVPREKARDLGELRPTPSPLG